MKFIGAMFYTAYQFVLTMLMLILVFGVVAVVGLILNSTLPE